MNQMQAAISAFQNNDFEQAETLLLNIVNRTQHVDARHLLGLICSRTGRYEQAVQWMQEALRISPQQPAIHNNLANALRRLNRFDEAIRHYQAAIAQQGDYADAYRNFAQLLMDIGQPLDAQTVLNSGLRFIPGEPTLLNALGLSYQQQNNFPAAIQTFQQALAQRPDYVLAEHNLGVALRLNNQPQLALDCYDRLAASGIDRFEIWQNKGNALSDLGRLEEAAECYRRVIAVAPDYVDAHHNLSATLWVLGEQENFLQSYEQVFDAGNMTPALALAYTDALLSVDRNTEAMNFLRQAGNRIDTGQAPFLDMLARSHFQAGDYPTAIALHEQALTAPGANDNCRITYGITLLCAGQTDKAVIVLKDVLSRFPNDQMALAHYMTGLQILGDPDADRLANPALIAGYRLPVPEGYPDLAAFNRALADYLTGLHTGKEHPYEQTLREGTQTPGNLFGREEPVLNALVAGLRTVIAQHIARVSQEPAPYPAFRGGPDFDFSGSWSVRLRKQGYHTQHIHPMGWFSSAYYVKVPERVRHTDHREGWISFGEPNLSLPKNVEPFQFEQPEPGKLVLFPSYMWHGTVPFDSDEERITVAFDVVPVHG
ncbi:MAG: tetratricopeptide repeat protein [Pseudomonadales bacterium]|nr:tetratricopeptide repeat protein [Pseudomonadales bacterium]